MKAEIFFYRTWTAHTDALSLAEHLDKLLFESGFEVLARREHWFQPQGFTCIWLLGESHLAVHTFPESDASYIELSSCNEAMLVRFVDGFQALGLGGMQAQQGSCAPSPLLVGNDKER